MSERLASIHRTAIAFAALALAACTNFTAAQPSATPPDPVAAPTAPPSSSVASPVAHHAAQARSARYTLAFTVADGQPSGHARGRNTQLTAQDLRMGDVR